MRPCYTSDTKYDIFAASAGTSIAQQLATYPGMTDHNVTHLLKESDLKGAVRSLMRAYIEESLVEFYHTHNVPYPPTNYMRIQDAREHVDTVLHTAFNSRHLHYGEEMYAALSKAIEEQVKPFVVDDLTARMDSITQKNPQNFKIGTVRHEGGLGTNDPALGL